MSRVAFVTNFCPHYRVRTFETLAQTEDVDFYFFSAGDDWYWLPQHSIQPGNFHYCVLPGAHIGGTRVTPTLPVRLLNGGYDAYVKCINGRFALPMTYLVARIARRPFVLWTGVWTRLQTPAHRIFFPVTRYLYRHADAVVVYGEHVRRFLENEGVSPQRIFVAPHAIDNAAYNREVVAEEIAALRRTLDVRPADKIVLYLGRLESGKGLRILLQAFASLHRSNAVLVLAGSGSEREQLERLATRLGIADRVRFPGYVSAADAVEYYAAAWVSVVPSVTTARFKEPWGLVVNEAFNQGLPVIATDAVGAAAGGLVQDGVNGRVVPEGDVAALALSVGKMLDDEPARHAMGAAARRIVAQWDNARMVAGFRAAIEFARHQASRC